VGPRAGLDGRKISPPTGTRSPDRPARSQSLYRLVYPAPQFTKSSVHNKFRAEHHFKPHWQLHVRGFFDVLLTVHLSIFILVINQLDAQNFCFTISLFHASTCFEHHVLIIRRSELYYTAYGIITPIGVTIPHAG